MVALCSLIPSAGYAENSLMGRYSPDQRSYTSEHLQLPIALNWDFTTTKFAGNAASPVVDGNKCIFSSGDRIYAVDLESGKMLWRYPDQPLNSTVKCTPAISDGSVYFGSGDGNLYCIDEETGKFQWAYQTRGPIRCPPVVYEGVVYVGTDDNSVYAIDSGSGEAIWRRPYTTKDDVTYGIAVSLGMVVVSSMDGNLYGISASTGALRWYYRLPSAPIRTSPIISESLVIMAVGDAVYGFTARSGQMRWLVNMPAEVAAPPACDGDVLYVACRDKKIYAYKLNTRQPSVKWTAPADFGSLPLSSPVVADDTLYITGSKGVVGAFATEDGAMRWRYIIGPSADFGKVYTDAASSPTIANGNLIVLTDDGVLHCFASGAPDSEKPQVFAMKPQNGYAISDVPPFKISAIVYDIGSGVDFSTVNLSLDGLSLDYDVDFSTSTITSIYGLSTEGKPVKKLVSGVHTVRLVGKDYAGNVMDEQWIFYADSRLPPPKQPTAATGKRTKDPVTGQQGTPNANRNIGNNPNYGGNQGRGNSRDGRDGRDRRGDGGRGGYDRGGYGRGGPPGSDYGIGGPPPPPTTQPMPGPGSGMPPGAPR